MVYEPREDSDLLASVVEDEASGKVLDMGTGPEAVQARAAQQNRDVTSIVATDVDEDALEEAKKRSDEITFLHSDLFESIEGRFDTIIFNAPYLPTDERAPDVALDGGKEGYEVTQQFLEQAPDYLEKEGKILLLISTLTKQDIVERIMAELLLDFEVIDERKLPFETLMVYRITKSDLLKELHEKGVSSVKKLTHGKRGAIYTGKRQDLDVAIKAQRPDSPAEGTVNHEAEILSILNEHGIGPHVLFSGDNYFCYRYIEGEFIEEALETRTTKQKQRIFSRLLDKMRALDELGIEKEEMTHPQKHVIINEKDDVYLVDFERARKVEEPSNVTQCLQYLSGLVDLSLDDVREVGKKYKETYSDGDFKKLKDTVVSHVKG